MERGQHPHRRRPAGRHRPGEVFQTVPSGAADELWHEPRLLLQLGLQPSVAADRIGSRHRRVDQRPLDAGAVHLAQRVLHRVEQHATVVAPPRAPCWRRTPGPTAGSAGLPHPRRNSWPPPARRRPSTSSLASSEISAVTTRPTLYRASWLGHVGAEQHPVSHASASLRSFSKSFTAGVTTSMKRLRVAASVFAKESSSAPDALRESRGSRVSDRRIRAALLACFPSPLCLFPSIRTLRQPAMYSGSLHFQSTS